MGPEELKLRSKKFAVAVIALAEKFPNSITGRVISNQIVRSATSVGTNYRAACRARSKADFINKASIVLEEADETLYWLEIIEETNLISKELIESCKKEATELTAIFTASVNTAKGYRY